MPTTAPDRSTREHQRVDEETALYRYFDDDDRLLYVGIANEPFRRMAQHRQGKGWWADVARMELERFPSRTAALDAERTAIQNENPVYNITHAPRPKVETVAVTLWCEVCHDRIVGASGYLCIDERAVMELERRRRAIEEQHLQGPAGSWVSVDLGGLLSLGPDVEWQAFHAKCDPNPTRNDYWISAERITTIEQLLDWNDHLLGKSWVAESSNWTELLAVASRTTTGPLRITRSTP